MTQLLVRQCTVQIHEYSWLMVYPCVVIIDTIIWLSVFMLLYMVDGTTMYCLFGYFCRLYYRKVKTTLYQKHFTDTISLHYRNRSIIHIIDYSNFKPLVKYFYLPLY